MMEFTGERVSALVGLITSLLLAYVPGFKGWWDGFAYKREVLAGFGFVVACAMVGLHYAGAIDLGLGAFGWPVVWQVLTVWLAFSGAGQLAYTAQRRVRG